MATKSVLELEGVMMDAKELVRERDKRYGTAWAATGQVLAAVPSLLDRMLGGAPQYATPWIMILNKLVRIAFDPRGRDNWLDIAGYAELVLRDLDGGEDK